LAFSWMMTGEVLLVQPKTPEGGRTDEGDTPIEYTDNEMREDHLPDPGSSSANDKADEEGSDGQEDMEASLTPRNYTPSDPTAVLLPVTVDPSSMVAITLLIGIPTFGFVLLFSALGYGIPVHQELHDNREYAPVLVAGSMIIALTLYLLDAEQWSDKRYWSCQSCQNSWKPLGRTRKFLIFVATCLFCAGVVFRVDTYSYGPLCVFLIFITGLIIVSRRYVFGRERSVRQYVGSLSLPLLLVAIGVFVWWCVWANQGSYSIFSPTVSNRYTNWSPATKTHYAKRIGCDREDDDELDDPYPDCFSAFLLWGTPCAVSFALTFFALVAYVLDPHEEHVAPKMIGQILLILIFGLWCSASLAGAGSVITEACIAFVFASVIALSVFTVYTFGLDAFQNPDSSPFVKRMKEKYGGLADVFRGLMVVTASPLLLIYGVLSFANQFMRKRNCCRLNKPLEPEERRNLLTTRANLLLENLENWKWTKVLVYALYWGIFFFSVQVLISKFTVLILSYLIQVLKSVSFGKVLVIFFFIGLFMFLLPPVPGIPVYLSSGIILVAAGEDEYGLNLSVVWAFCFSFVLKLISSLCQTVLIGIPLGKFVAVRRAVGVNTVLVRSMKIVLSQRGFSLAKATILTGGPDWPTSVFCGILRVNICQMMISTLPVGLLILPTVLAGTYFFLADRESRYATLATIFAMVAAFVQTGSMMTAAYFLDKAAADHKEEMEKMPYDEEVRQADEAAEVRKKKYEEATEWTNLPMPARAVLVSAVVLMVFCCYLVQLYSSACFEEYELTDTIRQELDSKWYKLVKYPAGYIAIIVFVLSCSLLIGFNCWANRHTSQLMA